MSYSLIARAGAWTYIAFFLAQVQRRVAVHLQRVPVTISTGYVEHALCGLDQTFDQAHMHNIQQHML